MTEQCHEPNLKVKWASKVRKRAAAACAFCRKRKIKCNAERPVCSNCRTYEKDCVYDRPGSKGSLHPSPGHVGANSQAGLSKEAHDRTPDEIASRDTGEARGQPQIATSEPSPRSAVNNLSRIVVSANGIPSYHVQTSALFEENQNTRSGHELRQRMPEEWVEKGLVAEAARQRQLEEYNFRRQALDFDGVEPELGMHLLSLHWNRQHHSFLITYRPAFMRDMACGGPYFSKLLLNAIYFGSSKFSPRHEVRKDRNDVRTAGWKFRERVRELLVSALDRSDVTTIQALLVMTNSLFALGDERGAAWLYAGLAFRMIYDLGIHVDAADVTSTRNFSDEDLEIRRRVFWGAFVVDKIQSLYQGRPVTMKESDTRVSLRFLDTYEELEHWRPFAYSTHPNQYEGAPSFSVSTFTALCRLSSILGDILSCIYTERSFDRSSTELSKMLDELHAKLAGWYNGLPTHLTIDPQSVPKIIPPPHVLSLHAMYYVLSILLHRPFIVDGHLHHNSRTISVNSFIVCATAASSIIRLLEAYDEAFSVRRAPYLISYATYVAATIHARIAAQKGPGSEAHRSLEFCLAVFQDNQETNSAVRRANVLIQNLMKRLGVSRSDVPAKLSGGIGQDTGTNSEQDELRPNETQEIGDQQPEAQNADANLDSFEIDEIIRMFTQEQKMPYTSRDVMTTVPPPSEWPGATYGNTQQPLYHDNIFMPGLEAGFQPGIHSSANDLLFGFNGSALDAYPVMDWTPEQ